MSVTERSEDVGSGRLDTGVSVVAAAADCGWTGETAVFSDKADDGLTEESRVSEDRVGGLWDVIVSDEVSAFEEAGTVIWLTVGVGSSVSLKASDSSASAVVT